MDKAYLVMGDDGGEYDGAYEWVVKGFRNQTDAEYFCLELEDYLEKHSEYFNDGRRRTPETNPLDPEYPDSLYGNIDYRVVEVEFNYD